MRKRNSLRENLKKKSGGQTLVEAIVALGVAVIIITALVAVTTTALNRAQFVKERTQAQKYAQEGLEWIRAERDKDWSDFANKAGLPPIGTSYCLNADPLTGWPSGACAANDYSLGGLFKREAVLERANIVPGPPDPDQVEVRVTVSWQEGGRTHKSEQTTYLTSWQ